MSERVMARVVRIDAVEKHPNADALSLSSVIFRQSIFIDDLFTYC